ncbi:MAG: choice-of-anchor D domain-containing protein [Calditrichaeota bacterium]|nr:choice-of-anchor D domain-containing protein [Calditrichota bacterium]
MARFRLPCTGLLALLFLAGASDALAQHFRFEPTDANMSILVQDATLDGESLVGNDEIGVFTPGGICAGGVVIERGNEFPAGLAAWGREGELNYFREGQLISFRVWDHEAEEEYPAQLTSCTDMFGEDARPNWVGGEFIVVELAAARGEPEPDIELSSGSHDFGAIRVGRQVEWTFTVFNRGRANLVISRMSIDGGPFSVNFQAEVSVGAGASRDFIVTFAPEQVNEYHNTLSITSNDPDEDVVRITLDGVGEAAAPPNIILSAAEIRFGRVMLGRSLNRSLYIDNDGDETLIVRQVASDNQVFTTDFENELRVPGGMRGELVINFEPREARIYEGVVSITSNDPNEGVVRVSVIGEGIEEGEPPAIAVYEDEHFFGNVSLGANSMWRLVVMNTGGSDLRVENVVSGDEVFSVVFPREAQRVRPGDYLYVPVTFAPAAEAFYYSALTIASNDPDSGQFVVNIGGIGTRDDGRHFRFYNTGANHSLLITEVTLDGNRLGRGSEVGVFTSGGFCAGGSVIADDGRVGVAAWGDDDATDIIDGFLADEIIGFKVWDAPNRVEAWGTPDWEEGPEIFNANGFSVLSLAARIVPAPDIELSAVRNYFGQVEVDESEDWTFRIVNRGRGVLTISSIESDLNEFTTNFQQPFDLEFAAGQDIVVTFAPSARMDYEGRLTLRSNDPVDSVLYIDLFGLGVDERREPEIVLSEANHFFGVQRNGGRYNFVLRLTNRGGGLLRIDSVNTAGAGFSTNWPGNPRQLDPNEFYDLTVTFAPVAAQQYDGSLRILSDDPNRGDITFPLRGVGTAEQTHFHRFQTGISHTFLVERGIIVTPNNNEVPITPGDEVATFTPRGLCAGFGSVQNEGTCGVTAFGNDPNTLFDDGFNPNDAITFYIYDRATRTEIVGQPEWIQGPQVFTPNGATTLNLRGRAEVEAAQCSVEPANYSFGVIHIRTQRQHTFRVSNIGGVNLTVSRVAANLNVFTTDFPNQPRLLRPGEGFDLVVTFSPDRAFAWDVVITVTSDDPRRPQFTFTVDGAGSDWRGHYPFLVTDQNHSILVRRFIMGGQPAAVGDEIGAFTPNGVCAGADTVGGDEQMGIAAWSDDGDTRTVEGFRDGQQITLLVWDASQRREYRPDTVRVVEGELRWEANELTVVDVVVNNVVATSATPNAQTIRETQEARIRVSTSNAPGRRAQFELTNPQAIAGRGDVAWQAVNDTTADFTWRTNFEAAGNYTLLFRAFNNDFSDNASASVTVADSNRAPVLNQAYADRIFPNGIYTVDERSDSLRICYLDSLFADPDRVPTPDSLSYSVAPAMFVVAGDTLRLFTPRTERIQNRPVWTLTMKKGPDINGEFRAVVTASDRRQQFAGGRAMRQIGSVDDETNEMFDPDAGAAPQRDATLDFPFTIRINPVNDTPVITLPANAAQFNTSVNEGRELRIRFQATDVDNAANTLRWAFLDRRTLPVQAAFEDSLNGSASLIWTPGFDQAGVYRPTFRVVDPPGLVDTILVQITVNDSIRGPRFIRRGIPDFILNPVNQETDTTRHWLIEDQAREDLVDLDTIFTDDDGDQLFYALTANPAQLQLAISNDNVVTAQPTANFSQLDPPLTVIITVRDRQQGGSTRPDTFFVKVAPVNDAPYVRTPISDVRNILEDTPNRRNIVNLAATFNDIDSPVAARRYAVEQAPAELNLQINPAAPNALSYLLSPDYNSWKSNALHMDSIIISCTDDSGAVGRDTFMIEVIPVDDAMRHGIPDRPFEMLTPVNGHRIAYDPDSLGVLNFSWRSAEPNRWEIDTTRYWVTFRLDNLADTLRTGPIFFDTLVANVPFQAILDSITHDNHLHNRVDAHTLWWWVDARDSTSILRASNAPFSFWIPPLEIRLNPDMVVPETFYLSGAYPNPFNAQTTLKFGLPRPEQAEISVWDMHGRKVATLSTGRLQAGQYELVWNAQDLKSGVYIVRMTAGAFRATQKAILVR